MIGFHVGLNDTELLLLFFCCIFVPSANLEHLKNELMHLTNHAIQRKGAASGKKWYVLSHLIMILVRRKRARVGCRWDTKRSIHTQWRDNSRLVLSPKI